MITSAKNQKIKNIVKLVSSAKARREQDVFIVEGIRMFREIPEELFVEAFISENFSKNNQDYLKNCKFSYEIVEDKIFNQMSGTLTPQGVLAVVKQSHYTIEDILSDNRTPHLILAEEIQDPGNLGTIIRCGEGAGITGIIMSKNTVDIYNPKTIRSTMGSIFRIPFIYSEDFVNDVNILKNKGVSVYAAHLKGEKYYDEMDYTKPVAFMIGNEGNGLSAEAAEAAGEYILIPMEGKVESLNAAIASSILMYETNRQRRKK